MERAVTALNGSPHISVDADGAEELWEVFVENDEINNIITAATKNCGSHDQSTASGIACSHAYTVLGTIELDDGTKLLKIRNPWGSESYTGDWSDESDTWTQSARD